jgi:predicted O-linked N-acetylglucosamine transferase (SPINDLY family)
MIRNGHVTFGVFNRIDKISDQVLTVWSRLLREVAGAMIVIKNGALDDPFLRDVLIGRFVAHGVAQDRIRCLGSSLRQMQERGIAGRRRDREGGRTRRLSGR